MIVYLLYFLDYKVLLEPCALYTDAAYLWIFLSSWPSKGVGGVAGISKARHGKGDAKKTLILSLIFDNHFTCRVQTLIMESTR